MLDVVEVRESEKVGECQTASDPEGRRREIRSQESTQGRQALGKFGRGESSPVLLEFRTPEGRAEVVLGVADGVAIRAGVGGLRSVKIDGPSARGIEASSARGARGRGRSPREARHPARRDCSQQRCSSL